MVTMIIGMLAGGFANSLIPKPFTNEIQYFFNQSYPNSIPDPYSLTKAYKNGFISEENYQNLMRQTGYSKWNLDIFKGAVKQIMSIEQICNLYYHGYMSYETAGEKFKQLGFNPDEAKYIIDGMRNYLPFQQYMELFRRGKITKDKLKEYLKFVGLRQEEINEVIELTKSEYSINMIITMRMRKYISEDDYYKYMSKLGYDKDKANKIMKISYTYPTPENFITFSQRKIFDNEMVKKYNLDEEFPEAIIPYAEKSGLQPDILKWFWLSHWQLPSPETVERMVNILQPDVINTKLPNGEIYGNKYKDFGIDPQKIITTYKDLSTYLSMAGISPYWRDRFKALTFPPITRIDLRRIYNLGLISEQELNARLLELGYSKKGASLLIDFYKNYKHKHEKELAKTEILDLYAQNSINKSETKEMLEKIGYNEKEQEMIIKMADFKNYKKARNDYIKILILKYSEGILNNQELLDKLNNLNLPSSEIAYWQEEANREKLKKSKIPTHKELMEMYKKGIINDSDFSEYMKRLGYSQKWINAYKKLTVGGGK